MSLFRHNLAFAPVDPLGDGLREDIEAEQQEPEAIRLEEDLHSESITVAWQQIVEDVEHDPDWFHFADPEQEH